MHRRPTAQPDLKCSDVPGPFLQCLEEAVHLRALCRLCAEVRQDSGHLLACASGRAAELASVILVLPRYRSYYSDALIHGRSPQWKVYKREVQVVK